MRLFLLIVLPISFAVSACKTVENERADMLAYGTQGDICFHASNPKPLLVDENKTRAAKQIVRERGIQCDWATYAAIHSQNERSRNAQLMTGLAMSGMLMAPTPQPQRVQAFCTTRYGQRWSSTTCN